MILPQMYEGHKGFTKNVACLSCTYSTAELKVVCSLSCHLVFHSHPRRIDTLLKKISASNDGKREIYYGFAIRAEY